MAVPVYVYGTMATSDFSLTITKSSFDLFNATSPTNRCVLLLLWTASTTTATASSATYAGNAMTAIGTNFSGWGALTNLQAFYLTGDANIPTGAQNIVGTFTGSTGSLHGCMAAYAFSGVSNSSGVVNATNGNAGNQVPSLSITSSSGDLAVHFGFRENTAHTISAGSGVTKSFDDTNGALYGGYHAYVLTKPGAGGATTVDGTISSSGDNWAGAGVSLVASSGGGGSGSRILTLGVG